MNQSTWFKNGPLKMGLMAFLLILDCQPFFEMFIRCFYFQSGTLLSQVDKLIWVTNWFLSVLLSGMKETKGSLNFTKTYTWDRTLSTMGNLKVGSCNRTRNITWDMNVDINFTVFEAWLSVVYRKFSNKSGLCKSSTLPEK